ncbi:hypothetical protein [Achromobacter pestifer]|nr:hypothetical protein [Achromobacter pestifer]
MTAEESNLLPNWTSPAAAVDGVVDLALLKQQRDAAMEKWKTDNPERYQQGLRAQERAASGQQTRTQAATNARQGAGGSGGGSGASSANTLLTGAGASQGVDPGALDLSKNTLLGL